MNIRYLTPFYPNLFPCKKATHCAYPGRFF